MKELSGQDFDFGSVNTENFSRQYLNLVSFLVLILASLFYSPFSMADNVSSADKFLASNGVESDLFGDSVAIDGDTLIVGAPGYGSSGAVYFYTRSHLGWSEQFMIRVVDETDTTISFGKSVAIDGSNIVVGSSDAAYVFKRDINGNWHQEAKLVGSGERFGDSVAIDNDTIVVGAWGEDTASTSNSGAAYVFTNNSAKGWTLKTKLQPKHPTNDMFFGFSVALHEKSILIGAAGDRTGSVQFDSIYRGTVYAYSQIGSEWEMIDILFPETEPDTCCFIAFGHSIEIDGKNAIIGAPGTGGSSVYGDAYVFTLNGSGWDEKAKLTPEEPVPLFGYSVSIKGDTVVVGSPYYQDHEAYGAAHVFSGTDWEQQARLIAFDANLESSDAFGLGVTVDENHAAIGASLDDDLGQSSGSVYIFKATKWE